MNILELEWKHAVYALARELGKRDGVWCSNNNILDRTHDTVRQNARTQMNRILAGHDPGITGLSTDAYMEGYEKIIRDAKARRDAKGR
jgi:hypothetical protein